MLTTVSKKSKIYTGEMSEKEMWKRIEIVGDRNLKYYIGFTSRLQETYMQPQTSFKNIKKLLVYTGSKNTSNCDFFRIVKIEAWNMVWRLLLKYKYSLLTDPKKS